MPTDTAEEPNILIVCDCFHQIGFTPLNRPVFLTFRAKRIKRQEFLVNHKLFSVSQELASVFIRRVLKTIVRLYGYDE